MSSELRPTDVAEKLGISPSYASQLLTGQRGKSGVSALILRAWRDHGIRLGVLAEMTDEDIGKLCAGDCVDPVHALADTDESAHTSFGKDAKKSDQIFETKQNSAILKSEGPNPSGRTDGAGKAEGFPLLPKTDAAPSSAPSPTPACEPAGQGEART